VIPINWYLILSAVLFLIGVLNLTFVAFSTQHRQISGQVFVFFVLVVAASEAAVGLALVIAMFRNRESLNVDRSNLLKW
jgi:NADH-quinone oxidoreductase subunit K